MGLLIRSLERTDLDALRDLMTSAEQEFGGSQPTADTLFSAHRYPDGFFFLSWLDQKLVGCGGMRDLSRVERHSCLLEYLYILPECRGQELGSALLSSLLHQARKQGYKQCYVACMAKQQALLRLCLQSGFVLLTQPVTGLESGADTWLRLEL